MTKNDKTNILHFITRTGMYIYPVDDKNVVSFIHGYELGTKSKCDFTLLVKETVSTKYMIQHSNDGWPGQIIRLSNKLSMNWVTSFKMIGLEIISNDLKDGFDKVLKSILQKRILTLIERIEPQGNIYFNEDWTEEWLGLCQVKSKWFQQLWTEIELETIQAIYKLIQTNSVFITNKDKKPSIELLEIVEKYKANI